MEQWDAMNDVVQLAGPAPVDAALVLPWLGQLVEHDDEDVREAAVKALAAGWAGDADALPLVYGCVLSDPSEDIQCDAVQAVADGWPDDPRTLPWLRESATV